MKIDLHVHTSTGSDGTMTLEEVMAEAKQRGIDLLSVTDHDFINHQGQAAELAARTGIDYITGVELNVLLVYQGKGYSLDFLGYGYDPDSAALKERIRIIQEHRAARAKKIIENLNREFTGEGLPLFSDTDLDAMQEGIDGVMSRPHIADYLVRKNIVADRQEAFDRYLVVCDVPKFPLSLPDASKLVRKAGGRLVLAHPNDPHGTSLVSITKSLDEQTNVVKEAMMQFIDGVECWHSRADAATTAHYTDFCKANGLIMTGGSDCHQKPLRLGTVNVPDFVAGQFGRSAA